MAVRAALSPCCLALASRASALLPYLLLPLSPPPPWRLLDPVLTVEAQTAASKEGSMGVQILTAALLFLLFSFLSFPLTSHPRPAALPPLPPMVSFL